jgi:RecA-family ATPase
MAAPFGDQFSDEIEDELEKARQRKARQQSKAEGESSKHGFKTVWANHINPPNLLEAGLIDGFLPRVGMVVMYGDSNTGKTFVGIDISCHVAAGKPWRGMDVEQGVVIYVAAEAPASVERRVWAWREHQTCADLQVLVVQSTVDLLNGDTDRLIELIAEVQASGRRVAMIVLDTLARSMVGNENDGADMGKYVSSCSRMREACSGLIMVIHHCGKDQAKGARGHSSLRAATDIELEVTPGAIKITKARDDEGATRYGFKLDQIELGTNSRGRVVTTCVAVSAEAQAPIEKELPMTSNQKIVLDCLAAAIVDRGREAPFERDITSGVKGVSYEVWEEAAERYIPGGERKIKRRAIRRAVDALQARRRIKHVDGFCWIPG